MVIVMVMVLLIVYRVLLYVRGKLSNDIDGSRKPQQQQQQLSNARDLVNETLWLSCVRLIIYGLSIKTLRMRHTHTQTQEGKSMSEATKMKREDRDGTQIDRWQAKERNRSFDLISID